MLLALDPSIVQAAIYDMDSMELLQYLGVTQNAAKLKVQIVVDESNILKKTYEDYLEHEGGWQTLSIKFAYSILDKWNDWTKGRPTDSLDPEVKQFIIDAKTDKLEGCLIALALYNDVLLSCLSPDTKVPTPQVRVILHNPKRIEQLKAISEFSMPYFPSRAKIKLEYEFTGRG